MEKISNACTQVRGEEMIDKEKLIKIIAAYKKALPEWWTGKDRDEIFKWKAIRCFQENWNIDAENFSEMFMAATEDAKDLLTSVNNYPRLMIRNFAVKDAEAAGKMFADLYDESRGLSERIEEFRSRAEDLRQKYDEGSWYQHYQEENPITTYLWLKYPDKYYIYKYSVVKAFARAVDSDFVPKKGKPNVEKSRELYDEIREIVKQDAELDRLLKENLNDECYLDPERITLTTDIGYFTYMVYSKKDNGIPQSKSSNTSAESGQDAEKTNSVDPIPKPVLYTKADFLKEVYMEEEQYDTLVMLLRSKKNLILQGAPGVGKTFAARRLAYSMMGEADKSRVEFIQFHQSYSYEDFVMGYKPGEEGFKLTEGVFYRFCEKAAADPGRDYFFIIDEINRGNMSKIFGELLMLIEKDYRGAEATLAYSGATFSVPANLYIIGMMNTADRSLAMIDYALRRRFSFFEMEPEFHSEGFRSYQAFLHNETFDELIQQVSLLNRAIKEDASLGAGFCIGHSYFCGQTTCTEDWMKSVVYYDVLPMLQEYWFDDKQKVAHWESILSGVFDD